MTLSNVRARVRDIVSSDEEYEDSVVSRMLLLICAGLLFRMGFSVWATLEPESITAGAVVLVIWGMGVQLLLFAVTGLSLKEHGTKIGYAVVGVLTLAMAAAILRGYLAPLMTDALLYSKYSAALSLEGVNPYAESMAPAFELEGAFREFGTPRIDGTEVQSLSYPAGAVLAFVPGEVLGIQARWTPLAAVAGIGAFLVWQAPAQIALGGPIVLMIARNQWLTAGGGVFDPIWVLSVVVGMGLWYREHYLAAAGVLAIAMSIKQLTWPMVPFLAIWIYHESAEAKGFIRRATPMVGVGFSVFVLVNLPYILADPQAWLGGVLTPVAGGAPLVNQGLGVAVLSSIGVLSMATWWHTVAMASVAAVLLTAYALYFEKVRWLAFVAPAAIWFMHSRSLSSYFVTLIPVAMMAILCEWGEARGVGLPDALRVGDRDRQPLAGEVSD